MSETGEGPESLTLHHLRALDAKLDQMAKDMARGFETVTGHLVGITGRIAGLEIRMSAMETWSAETTKRLDRIERRLGLVEPPPWPGQEC
jgi:hypothetical protein